MKTVQCNMPHWQNEGEKAHVHLNWCRENIHQHPFTIKLGIEENYLNIMKGIYENLTANIFNSERP